MGNGHETTGSDESVEVAEDDVELFEDPEGATTLIEIFRLLDVDGDVLHFLAHLLGGTIGKDALDHPRCLFRPVVVDQLAWGFRTEWEQANENNGGNGAQGYHVSPAVVDVREACANAVRD